jgi:hypothetical protein
MPFKYIPHLPQSITANFPDILSPIFVKSYGILLLGLDSPTHITVYCDLFFKAFSFYLFGNLILQSGRTQ